MKVKANYRQKISSNQNLFEHQHTKLIYQLAYLNNRLSVNTDAVVVSGSICYGDQQF